MASDKDAMIERAREAIAELRFDMDEDDVALANAALTASGALEMLAEKEGERALLGFQQRVNAWMLVCFGNEIAMDGTERNHRFIEEALELVQAGGCTASEAHQLVDYVFGRPAGEQHQETGGVAVTLAALCTAFGLDMSRAAEDELARVWTKVETIRAKQAAKPKHSPLPSPPEGSER